VCLCLRTGYLQVVKSDELKKKAINQQTKDELVDAKRGEIVDRNGNKLAVSSLRYSVWVRPASVIGEEKDPAKQKEKLQSTSRELAAILGKDASEIMTELTRDIPLVKIAKYQSSAKANKIRKAELTGVSLTEETKRAYPLGNFASQLLGSVTDDNNGLSGIEQYYNRELRGAAGRWVQSKDAAGNSLFYGEEKYYAPEDGHTLELTVDEAIQHYAEEAIVWTMKETGAARARCIVMDPKTGGVLAMAASGGFDPNNARDGSTDEDKEKLKNMKDKDQLEYLNQIWRNPLVNDTYEPGSTFKLFTLAMALEENLTKLKERFFCSGSINVKGTVIKCWSFNDPHGSQNLEQALGNSCNPVFVQLAQRIGIDKFYKYLGLFGFDEKTGIDYPGEASALFQDAKTAGPVGTATVGFGQGIAVTPIQLITGVCSLVNDGVLMKPHIVKAIKDKDGKVVKKIKPKKVRQTVSVDTAHKVLRGMEYVVAKGGAEKAQVEGYRIGGKTGTANKVNPKTGRYYKKKIIASFVGVAPVDDPKMVVLFIVDDPPGEAFGSTVAAPGAQRVMKNTLRYMGVKRSK
jgi:stage V sporulation protein D (sporulation-specific penicillin-binding protein)